MLSEMEERGYSIEWKMYNSKDYGVPQNRERVYIVGYLGETGGRELLPQARKGERTIKKVIGGSQAERVYDLTLLYKFIDFSKKNPQTTEHARCLTARYDRGISNRAGESSGVMAVLTPNRTEKRQNGRRIKDPGEPSFTLTAQDIHGVALSDGSLCRIRKLTPKECWRLQGFTDDQYEKAASVNSKSQLYKQAGNAVTVNVTYEIGKHIIGFEKNDEGEK